MSFSFSDYTVLLTFYIVKTFTYCTEYTRFLFLVIKITRVVSVLYF